jgi:hypothetical protein
VTAITNVRAVSSISVFVYFEEWAKNRDPSKEGIDFLAPWFWIAVVFGLLMRGVYDFSRFQT